MTKTRLNFMPPKVKKDLKATINYDLLIVCFFAFCLGVVIFKATLILHQENVLNKNLKKQIITEKRIEKSIQELMPNKNRVVKTNKSKVAIKEVIDKKLKWPQIFKELTHIVPQDIWLNQFLAKNESGEFDLMMSGRSPSHSKTSHFFSSIEKSRYFNQALLSFSERIPGVFPTQYSFNFSTPGFIEQKKLEEQKKKQISPLSLFSKPHPGVASLDNKAASDALKSVLSDQLRLDALSAPDKKKPLSQ